MYKIGDNNQGGMIIQGRSGVLSAFMNRVYMLMSVALVLTGASAYYVSVTPSVQQAIFGSGLVWGLVVATLLLVVVLSGAINKMSPTMAMLAFVAYSLLNGLMLSSLFIIYTQESIASVFFICAATFFALSIYGTFTKRDLTGLGGFMKVGLVGLIIASIANMFLQMPSIYWMTSYVGVAVFAGLIAYDTQKLKDMAGELDGQGSDMIARYSIIGALQLYLDFVNLFIYLLRIFGRRK
ncbi:Bax inhibitor-1/YccA family protein [Deferribacterales bacterium RsTz2092]|nr:membrane protein [Deferribacterales bacterium]